MDALEIRQPSAGTEVRRVVCGAAARAPGHGDHTVGSEFCRQPNGLAKGLIVLSRKVGIGVNRVAPSVECIETDVVAIEQRQPFATSLFTGKQLLDIAMRMRCVATGAHLDHRHVGSLQ